MPKHQTLAPVALMVGLLVGLPALAGCDGTEAVPEAAAATVPTATPTAVMSRSVAPAKPSVTRPATRHPSRSLAGRTLDAAQVAAMTQARASVSDGEIMRQLANTAERIAQQLAAGGAGQAPAPTSISPGSNRARGYALMISFGWPASEWPALDALWQRESGWNQVAQNRSSGAYGIPQALPGTKMATVAADWKTNPETQIRWGLAYIGARYGSPTHAWQHSQQFGWY